ncbi:class F sortase [Nocardioides sp. CER19]|uniref:class F sortase n=1 Tax=Nocardioides sp. CER19 TaxID=3038538 RepID=UPI00244939B6|nr:class F sortase [Nocardioides sp. CER19]MDH2413057.1 class F sortase [Nocardioides sp. CER19]
MKRLLVLPILALTAFAATGCAASSPAAHRVEREPSIAASTTAGQTRAPRPRPVRPVRPVRPATLSMWKFDAPVVPIRLSGSELIPPADPSVLGWWGKPAGARTGTTLLTGHTVHTGGGELDDLELTPVGSTAQVSGIDYDVTSVSVISKAKLAHRATHLFAQDGASKLVVVTCEGYDPSTGHYADNVVVIAKPRSDTTAVRSS